MEQPIYGADRLGTFFVQGSIRRYELKDHMGNVRGLLLRSKNGINADIYSFKDYYAFGSKAQSGGADDYRYDYQGQFAEKDKETDWNAFDLRMYDAKIGRWLSVDPKNQYWSPYVGMGNNPVSGIDPDGAFKTWFGAFRAWIGGGFKGEIHKANDGERKGEYYIGTENTSASLGDFGKGYSIDFSFKKDYGGNVFSMTGAKGEEKEKWNPNCDPRITNLDDVMFGVSMVNSLATMKRPIPFKPLDWQRTSLSLLQYIKVNNDYLGVVNKGLSYIDLVKPKLKPDTIIKTRTVHRDYKTYMINMFGDTISTSTGSQIIGTVQDTIVNGVKINKN
ncbi:hypothetical protein D3C80_1041410 [compost metagenome]